MRKRFVITFALFFCIMLNSALADIVIPEYAYIPTFSECELYDFWQSADGEVFDYYRDGIDYGLYEVQYYYVEDFQYVVLYYTISKKDSPYNKETEMILEYDRTGLVSMHTELRDVIREIPSEAVSIKQQYWGDGRYRGVEFSLGVEKNNKYIHLLIFYNPDGSYVIRTWEDFSKLVIVEHPNLEMIMIAAKWKQYLDYINPSPIVLKQEGTLDLDNLQQWVKSY